MERERGRKRGKHRERVSEHIGIFKGIKGECYDLFGALIGRIKYNPHVQINCMPIIAAKTILGMHNIYIYIENQMILYLII